MEPAVGVIIITVIVIVRVIVLVILIIPSSTCIYPLCRCNSMEQALPLQLEPAWEESRLLGQAPEEVREMES